jgi:TATA-box binding protein (TBP) (component of TFIID and TFIIIB)
VGMSIRVDMTKDKKKKVKIQIQNIVLSLTYEGVEFELEKLSPSTMQDMIQKYFPE